MLIARLKADLAATNDLVKRAEIYRAFEGKMDRAKCTTEDVLALVAVCKEFTPLALKRHAATPKDIWGSLESYLKEQAAKGLLNEAYADVTPLLPSDKILAQLGGRVEVLARHIKTTDEGVVWEAGYEDLCGKIFAVLRGKKGKRSDRAAVLNHALASMAAISARDFYHCTAAFGADVSAENQPSAAGRAYQSLVPHDRPETHFAAHTCAEYRSILPFIQHRVELHQRLPPSKLSPEDLRALKLESRSTETMWECWAISMLRGYDSMFSRITARMASTGGHSSQTRERTAITSHFGAFTVLLMSYLACWDAASVAAASAGVVLPSSI